MIDTQLLATARAAFAAVDVSAENLRIAELEAERERIAAATEKAEARARAISVELAAYIARDRGEEIADALLADVSPSEASAAGPNREALIEERGRLNAGIINLRRRDDDAVREIIQVQRDATNRLAPIAKPLIDALLAEATRGAECIAAAFAGLDAIAGTTKSGTSERDRAGLAVARMLGSQGLLPFGEIPVDAAIVATLRELQGKGRALNIGVRAVALPPLDLATSTLIAGAIAGLRQAA